MTATGLFNENGYYFGPRFPRACVIDCSAPGRCDEAIEHWTLELGFEVPRQGAIDYLARLGAWTREDLTEWTDTRLAETVLWLACGDIKENGDWYGLGE